MTNKRIWTVTLILLGSLLLFGSMLRAALDQKQSVPKTSGNQPTVSTEQLREAEVKQLLLLMDTDKNGKISKKEWMAFMEAEFNRLDTDKSGEIDPKELAASKLRPASFPAMGK